MSDRPDRDRSPLPILRRRTFAGLLPAALLAPWPAGAQDRAVPGAARSGTFLRPFAADSLWNSRPVDPVLGDFTIPKSDYYPLIGEGAWSTGVFLARASDPPATVAGPPNRKGLWDPDAEAFRPAVTLPHWPGDVLPAKAADGHADIVDEATGIVHSFYQLRRDGERWLAAQYAWTRLDGRGWGDPAHYFQGARAAGVPTMAGLMRKHEVNDGDTQFRHALAMSLTFNAMAAAPAYVFPATSADHDAKSTNTGRIPEGTLLMLPPDFDTGRLRNVRIRKVAETLKTYGGYVVDRNVGTPYVIYVENGSDYNLHPPKGWNTGAATDLETLRPALRPVVSAAAWLDADGRRFVPSRRLNLLSMRGDWKRRSGDAEAAFDTWRQALVVRAAREDTELANAGGRNVSPPDWARPERGAPHRLTARASGGARLRVDIVHGPSGKVAFSSGWLEDGESRTFDWPTDQYLTTLAVRVPAGREAAVSGQLVPGG